MLAMNDGMLSFDGLGVYEQPSPRLLFRMPRVVPGQKAKFETDELFRRLSRESEVKYTGHRDKTLEERRSKFQSNCREGQVEVSFTTNGTNLHLVFTPTLNGYLPNNRDCEFDTENGRVHIRSHFILNGVCVKWRGWIDLERLDGVACLEFDEEKALYEDTLLQEQMERYHQRRRELDERRGFRPQPPQDHELQLRMGNGGQQAGQQQRCQRLALQGRKKTDSNHGLHL